uniref:Putative secreted protein n=1 Tax=Amblyomma triste TaxID=251400 RepID=A0A023G4E8_AMBTT
MQSKCFQLLSLVITMLMMSFQTQCKPNARLKLVGVAVTEFIAITTSSPPFKDFTVFRKFNYNETLIEKVWHQFDDFVFRRCKQDMRQQAVIVYEERMTTAANTVGTFDSTLLLEQNQRAI